MILLQDKPNINPPDSEFPFGSIRDRDGIIAGTPGNQLVYNDLHQFAEKIIRESTLTPNGVLDSEYNGYQLWEAFEQHVKNLRNYQRYYVKLTQSGTSAPTVDNEVEADFGSATSIVRASAGKYEFYFSGTPIDLTGKTFIHYNNNWSGHAEIFAAGTNQINVWTLNSSAAYADNLLSSTDIYVDVYE